MGHSNQDELNRSEWENPDNWSTLYFSKKDSRTVVPKRNPSHGWTINFGSRRGSGWLYWLFLLFFVLGLVLGFGAGFFL